MKPSGCTNEHEWKKQRAQQELKSAKEKNPHQNNKYFNEMNYLLSVTQPGAHQIRFAPVHPHLGSYSTISKSDGIALA